MSVKTLRNLAYVASRFDPSRRRDDVSWSHHAVLAGLDPSSQDLWLGQVAAAHLTVRGLRVALMSPSRESEPAAQTASQPPLPPACPRCGLPLCGERLGPRP